MILSTQVTFRNMTAIADVRKTIESRIQKLESVCKPILRCRVTIEAPANHHRKGDPFNVRIDTTLTDGRITVNTRNRCTPAKAMATRHRNEIA